MSVNTILVSDLKVGNQLLTWMDKEVTLVAIRTEKGMKPIVAEYNGRVQYFHYDQITAVI